MTKIEHIGVVGAGTMGAALAQKFATEGLQVILVDQVPSAVEKALTNIKNMLEEGIERNVFTKERVATIQSNIQGSHQLIDLIHCNLIVEAIFENLEAKKELFKSLSTIVQKDCIIASNTSSFSISDLSTSVLYPERFIGMHFFYHAAKNRLVEIIPGMKTSVQTLETTKQFASIIGKDAIECKDKFGFAVNRFFVPWLNEAVRILEEGIANTATIDNVCKTTFGIGMGPFALMNATGIPIAYHSEKTLEVFGKAYEVAPLLKTQAESGKNWTINDELIESNDQETKSIIKDRMLAIVFLISSQILDEEVCTATHLNRGAKIGLRWKKGPVELMLSYGFDEVVRLISSLTNKYNLPMPVRIGGEFWKMESVRLNTNKDFAVITIDQPENLNALSETTVDELYEKFCLAENNPQITTIFITGSGKAFVAGADIKFFVRNIKQHTIEEIETFTRFTQNVFDHIDHSTKKVIMIINGLALGGGLELALCADQLFALPTAQFAFPETGIGIYPALGGTQRCAKKIGKGLSKYLIHTGKMLSSTEALEIGLADQIISKEQAIGILAGNQPVPAIHKKELKQHWKDIQQFFEKYPLAEIQNKSIEEATLTNEELTKIIKSISYKAPIAIRIADRLIEEAKGCDSELNYLSEIFSTSDALAGLTSIGQKIKYTGK
jgi:enoyl-CoA hydratase/3-hydroxyacyl-CoA dehydrogenase